jgi:TatD DNase family protein
MWFDSHCHLHLCETGTPSQLVEAAAAAGVEGMVTIGIDVASSLRALELASDQRVFAAVGLHPNSADEWGPETEARLEELVSADRVVAVGETGLDFYRDHVTPEQQRPVFEAHIDLAKRHDKALVIHTRSSIDAAMEVLASVGPPDRFVFHCWSGDRDQLARALEMGATISFAGNVSFKNAQDLRDAAMAVPADRLLVETDSPYLTPVPHRGEPNEPSHVALVGEAVAIARGQDVGTLARSTTANARRFFGID